MTESKSKMKSEVEMTSSTFDATLIDDSCFSDIFTMQSQTLHDFDFGLEANNIDSLLELFEEREKANDSIWSNSCSESNMIGKNNVTVTFRHKMPNKITISSSKISKSGSHKSSETSLIKRKGTSLLAKPKNKSRRAVVSLGNCDLQTFSSFLLQDHDYCIMSTEMSNKLYNKLPDYITTLKNITHDNDLLNEDDSQHYDKIPNYIKGFLNNEMNEGISESTDGDILIEFNEVTDNFFNDEILNVDNNLEVSNLITTDVSNNLNSSLHINTESKDKLEEILSIDIEHQLPNDDTHIENHANIRKSRSRSRESHNEYKKSRRRKISTRSSVDSSSQSSRSSSLSSCSSCHSYSSESSDDINVRFKRSNSIVGKDGQHYSRKRSLKESYCHNNYQRSQVKTNYDNKNVNLRSVRIGKQSFDKDIAERKIVYVGKIPEGTTKTDLRHWFGLFGAIKEVSIHFRDYGDNYAFVTFHRKCDAYEAIEHANEDSRHPKFDLSFGGRRQFCKTRYEDLDYADNSAYNSGMDFDALLKTTRAKLNR